jgi:hypothetical protein
MDRQNSWRNIELRCATAILAALEAKQYRLLGVRALARQVGDEVLRNLRAESDEASAALAFTGALPAVLSRCDENPYDEPFAALGYAFLHLTDRYRRFWRVLEELLRCGALPVHKHGIDVLDVGTGPAPTYFALMDFWNALRVEAAALGTCNLLSTPLPRVVVVESSPSMLSVSNMLAEHCQRPGPGSPRFADFGRLDLEAEREQKKRALEAELIDEFEYGERWARHELNSTYRQAEWRDAYRYNLSVFANFLTSSDALRSWEPSLDSVWSGLRPGGVAIVMGGTGGHYAELFDEVEKFAAAAGLIRVAEMPGVMPLEYDSPETEAVKSLYERVWAYLTTRVDLAAVERDLPRDIWDVDTPISGPRAMGVRVFRVRNRPDRRRR